MGQQARVDLKLTATVAADNEAPTVKSVTAEAEDKIVVVFSEDVNENQAEDKNNYVIKKDGKEIDTAISSITYDSNETKVTIVWMKSLVVEIYNRY